jgi:hypothetical protein
VELREPRRSDHVVCHGLLHTTIIWVCGHARATNDNHFLIGCSATKAFADALLWPVSCPNCMSYRLSSLPCHSLSSYNSSFLFYSVGCRISSIPAPSTSTTGAPISKLTSSTSRNAPHEDRAWHKLGPSRAQAEGSQPLSFTLMVMPA